MKTASIQFRSITTLKDNEATLVDTADNAFIETLCQHKDNLYIEVSDDQSKIIFHIGDKKCETSSSRTAKADFFLIDDSENYVNIKRAESKVFLEGFSNTPSNEMRRSPSSMSLINHKRSRDSESTSTTTKLKDPRPTKKIKPNNHHPTPSNTFKKPSQPSSKNDQFNFLHNAKSLKEKIRNFYKHYSIDDDIIITNSNKDTIRLTQDYIQLRSKYHEYIKVYDELTTHLREHAEFILKQVEGLGKQSNDFKEKDLKEKIQKSHDQNEAFYSQALKYVKKLEKELKKSRDLIKKYNQDHSK
mmetsp:Transcript_4946/g.7331  ORF Transcript_4946/g.7331 Transcript_4946/m.7331 type:complete len:301 (+) Transcript_4946:24-926(+)